MTDLDNSSDIEYKNFRPRTGMEPTASRLINESIRSIGPEAKAKTVITDQGDRFVFSIVVAVKKAFYSTEAVVTKEEMTGGPRLWQIHKLHRLLIQILKTFIKR